MAHSVTNLEFQVKDKDIFGAEIIRTTKIPVEKITTGEPISGWFPIIGPSVKPPKPDSVIQVELQFMPFETCCSLDLICMLFCGYAGTVVDKVCKRDQNKILTAETGEYPRSEFFKRPEEVVQCDGRRKKLLVREDGFLFQF
ncbi:hypothetical protein EV1_044272 [Malus domestica]